MDTLYLNGEWIHKNDAKISVFDRGFLFADGVYEVIPMYGQQCFESAAHLERLQRSLEAIQITPPLSVDAWQNVISQLITHNSPFDTHAKVYIQVTRGAQEKRSHDLPKSYEPTTLAICMPRMTRSLDELSLGKTAITLEDQRRTSCYIKSVSLLPNIMAHDQANNVGADEAILIRHGLAREATSSNLFIVKDNNIITPPTSPEILEGITRGVIIQLAAQQNIPLIEREINEEELTEADEIWLTGSEKEIMPIVMLNGSPIKDGRVGPIWKTMITLYHKNCGSQKNCSIT